MSYPYPDQQSQQPQELDLDTFEERVARSFGIPRKLRESLKSQESGGSDAALSRKGARGRLQVMPDTVRKYGLNPDDEFDQVYAGLKYLKEKYDEVDKEIADPVARWQGALAGYHGGERQIRHINRTDGQIAPGNDGLIETSKYVDNIMSDWKRRSAEPGSGSTPPVQKLQSRGPVRSQATPPVNLLESPLAETFNRISPIPAGAAQPQTRRAPAAARPRSAMRGPIPAPIGREFDAGMGGTSRIIDDAGRIASNISPAVQMQQQPPAPPGVIEDVVNRLGRAIVRGGTSAARGIAATGQQSQEEQPRLRTLERWGGRSGPATPVRWNAKAVDEAMRPIEEATNRALPVDPNIQPSLNPLDRGFWQASVPEGIGSTVIPAAATLLTRGRVPGGFTMGVTGYAQNAGQTYEEAKQAGFTDEHARAAAQIGGAIGTLESIGLGRALEKFGVKRAAIKRGLEILEEGGQEALTQWLNNINAAVISKYDPTRPMSEDVAGNFLLGAVIGAGFQAPDVLASRSARRTQRQGVAAEPPAMIKPTTPVKTEITPLNAAIAARRGQPAATSDPAGMAEEAGITPAQSGLMNRVGQWWANRGTTATEGDQDLAATLQRLEAFANRNQPKEPSAAEAVAALTAEADPLIQFAAANFETDPETAQQAANEALTRLKKAQSTIKGSKEYQAELLAKSRGEQAPAPAVDEFNRISGQISDINANIENLTKPAQEADNPEDVTALVEFARANVQSDPETAKQAANEAITQLRKAQNTLRGSEEYRAELRARSRGENVPTPALDQFNQLSQQIADVQKVINPPAPAPAPKPAPKPTVPKAPPPPRRDLRMERAEREAQSEISRMRQFDAATQLAAESETNALRFLNEGRTSEGLNELRLQQKQLSDAIKFLPNTPEGLSTKAALNRRIGQIGNQIGEVRRASPQPGPSITPSKPQDSRAEPLLGSVVNPEGGIVPNAALPSPGGSGSGLFGRLADEQRNEVEELQGLLQSIRRAGGIRQDKDSAGEWRRIAPKESGTTGLVNNRSGFTPDEMREMMVSEGLSQAETVGEFFAEIEDAIRTQNRRRDQETEAEYLDRLEEQERAATSGALESAMEGGKSDGVSESRPRSIAETAQDDADLDPEDLAAFRRLLERESAPDSPRTRPGAPGSGLVSFSPYNVLITNNRDAVTRLYKLNLNSPEAQAIIQDLREYSDRNKIEMRHLHALLDYIRNDQIERARLEDAGVDFDAMQDDIFERQETFEYLAEQESTANTVISLAIDDAPLEEADLIELRVSAIDYLFDVTREDPDMMALHDAAITGSEQDYQDFLEAAEVGYGFDRQTARDLIDGRRADYRARQANRNGGAPAASQAGSNRVDQERPLQETRGAAEEPGGEPVSADVARLLNRDPLDIPDAEYDSYLEALEGLRNQLIREPESLPEWAARQLKAKLTATNDQRKERVKAKRLPARFKVEPKEKIGKEEGARRMREAGQRTVSHPDPAIDGQPVIAETQDGRVIVPNPENKAGVSVVKDRAETAEPASQSRPIEDAITALKPAGALVSLPRLRAEYPTLSPEEFNAMVLTAAEEGRIALSRDNRTEAMIKRAGDDKKLVKNSETGDYYIGASVRESAPAARTETYWKGDRAEYTGKTQEIGGQTLYELELMEGSNVGKTAFTSQTPTGENPNVERSRREWKQQQEEFSRLHKKPTEAPAPEFGAENAIFTKDRADKARETLKRKLRDMGRQTNTGAPIDPEIVQAGIDLAGYYIEAGARSFADFSRRMVEDLGESVRPFLKSWYLAVRNYPGFDRTEMESEAEIDDLTPGVNSQVEETDERRASENPDRSLLDLDQPQADAGGTRPDDADGERELRAADQVGDAERRSDNARDGVEPAGGSGRAESQTPARTSKKPGSPKTKRTGKPRITAPPAAADLLTLAEQSTESLNAAETVLDAAVAALPAEAVAVEPDPQPEPQPAKEVKPKKQVKESKQLRTMTGASFDIGPATMEKLESGGQMTKYRQNIAAIETMRNVLRDGRPATREEQEIMALYAGFGGISNVFNPYHYSVERAESAKWQKAQEELINLIGREAFDSARRSTQSAYYTSPRIIQAMWTMAERLGFKGGRVLEPSMGSGNFLGVTPVALREKTAFTGVELDLTTGEIARLLYPDSNIKVDGFENLQAPDDFYDVAIGNVPFGDYRISDPRYDKFAPQIHNYFFLKALDKVRPGGLVMFITSTGTLDSGRAQKVREELHKKADLVEAFRFPAETFSKTALTSVVTDLIVLRKRLPGEAPGSDLWTKTGKVKNPDGGAPIQLNSYLDANRQQILGEFNGRNKMYPGRANVDRTDDFADRFAERIAAMPADVMSDRGATAAAEVKEASKPVKAGGLVVENGKLYVSDSGGLKTVEAGEDRIKRASGLLGIRDIFNDLTNAELGRTSDDPAKHREALNKAYDAFVRKHGPIFDKKNREALAGDPDLPRLMALEDYDSRRKIAKKMPIFAKSTVVGTRSSAKPETVTDAVVQSMQERGELVLPLIAGKLGLDERVVAQELVSEGIAYQTPAGNWELASRYLSGNVRRKLSEAQAAAENDPFFEANVDALKAVMPRDLVHTEISVEIGAPWIEPYDISAFVGELFGDNPEQILVHYDRGTGAYQVELGQTRARFSTETKTTWGTPDVPFADILDLALAGRAPRVMKTIRVDGKDQQIFDAEATQAAATKLDAVKQKFREWIWEKDDRRERLTRRYNEMFNALVPANYDASFMGEQLPGMNPEWKMRPHQMAAVLRAVIEKRGLMAHEVGLGKTLAMIASASELKRLGIARKPAIAVPKKVLPGFAETARDAFPLMKIQVIDGRDAEKRQRTMSEVATGDYDLVLMTHDNMDMLKMRPEFEASILREELDEVNAVYRAMMADEQYRNASKQSAAGRIVKQIEKRRERLAAKLNDALKAERKDDTITFEDTGIDFLFVDEFHKYKSLPVVTALGNVKGVPTGDSQRAVNMLMRARYLQSLHNGGGIIAATGTPISNSLVEAWIMGKFLQPDVLAESGVQSFDAWARNFAETVPALELDATGRWKTTSRMSKFRNLPELQQLARVTLDVKTAAETGILQKRPKRQDKVVSIPMSEDQKFYMQVLQQRAEAVKGNKVDPSTDNYLVISSDGRQMASDLRLVVPGLEADPNGKVAALAKEVLRIHKEKPGTTQMVFSDSGVAPNAWGFRLYDEIIGKLVEGGIPKEKIIDFSKLDSDVKVEKAVDRLNSGDAVIAIGHRENMGTGVNAQQKMAAIHQFDVPWKPALIEQSEARGWRQGNENPEVEIISYVVEGSFDAVMWGAVARKQQGIHAFMRGETTSREMEDADDEAMSYEQIAAVASGDGDYLLKAQLQAKVFKMELMERAHESERTNRESQIPQLERRVAALNKEADGWEKAQSAAKEVADGEFSFVDEAGKVYAKEDKTKAANALMSSYLFTAQGRTRKEIGQYKGLKVFTDGYEHMYMMLPVKGEADEKIQVNPNTAEFVNTFLSMDANINGLASGKNAKRIKETTIPALEEDLAKLREVKNTPFPYTEQLSRARRQLEAVSRRLAAKTKEGEEDVPLIGKSGLDIKETARLGRMVRRAIREKEIKPADASGIIKERLELIRTDSEIKARQYREYKRQQFEDYLAEHGVEEAAMRVMASTARRAQDAYDPDIDAAEEYQAPKGQYYGAGLGGFQAIYDRIAAKRAFKNRQPQTTPLREILQTAEQKPLDIEPALIEENALTAIKEAIGRGPYGTLPGARALYWSKKLGAKGVATKLSKRQAKFINETLTLIENIWKASDTMRNAKRGGRDYESAKVEMDRARIKLRNHMSRVGEYTRLPEYLGRYQKASILAAPHIPVFNLIDQVLSFPLHQAQRAADVLVPAKTLKKYGLKYEKTPVDFRIWYQAMGRELDAVGKGISASTGDIWDMLKYGVTRQMLSEEAARSATGKPGETGGTDKFELGNRPRMIPGIDQAIMAVGRVQGAADILFRNITFATALAAEADAQARALAKQNPALKEKDVQALARDFAHEPSPAMVLAAADASNRFVLDYPTLGYELFQKARNWEGVEKAGKTATSVWKAAFDFAIPFSKIPLAAVDMALFRYSPVGAGRVVRRMAETKAKIDEAERQAKLAGKIFDRDAYQVDEAFTRDTVEMLRQSLVGTIGWSLMGLMGTLGYAAFTGGDDDRQRIANAKEALGEGYNPELHIGDYSADLKKLGTLGRAASAGARIHEGSKGRVNKETGEPEEFGDRALRLGEAAKDAVLLDNPIGNVFKDFERRNWLESQIRGKIRGMQPGALRDVAKITTPNRVIPDQNATFTDRLSADLASGRPGARAQMQPRLNALGEVVPERNPFALFHRRESRPEIEETVRLGVGLPKAQRDKGESAVDYNKRLQEKGSALRRQIERMRNNPALAGASDEGKRAIYDKAFDGQQMRRAAKLSDASIEAEEQIEILRADALRELSAMPGYKAMSRAEKESAQKAIGDYLKAFSAGSVDRRGHARAEKAAAIPDLTPSELAERALGATVR